MTRLFREKHSKRWRFIEGQVRCITPATVLNSATAYQQHLSATCAQLTLGGAVA